MTVHQALLPHIRQADTLVSTTGCGGTAGIPGHDPAGSIEDALDEAGQVSSPGCVLSACSSFSLFQYLFYVTSKFLAFSWVLVSTRLLLLRGSRAAAEPHHGRNRLLFGL